MDDSDYVIETIKSTFVDFIREMYDKGLCYGSCVTIVLLDREKEEEKEKERKKRLYQINLGDSRSYVLNKFNDTFFVTEDHNCRSNK